MRIIRCLDGSHITVECLADSAPVLALVELVLDGRAARLSPSDARALARALVEQAERADAERERTPEKTG